MGSSRAKGRRTLNKAKDYLTEQGFIVDEVELGGRFRKSKDLFSGLCLKCWKADGCEHDELFSGFDLIALKYKFIWLVQVKTNTPATQQPYKKFASKFASRYIRVVVMTWYDRQGFRIQTYNKSGTITEKDLRGS